VQLTEGERLIVIMLADLMQGAGHGGEVDPELVKRLAINKDDWAFSWKYPGIFTNESGPSDEVVAETANILSMMSFIEYSVAQLPPGEVEKITPANRLRFRGFDGNHDPHHSVAHTMIHDLERFEEFAGRDLNSHSQATLAHYRRMMPIYEASQHGADPLGLEVLQALAGD